jgi:hypothetical protein
MTARATDGYGNPDAKQLNHSPEAASSGRTIAPAPPGGLSFSQSRCGYIRNDGKECMNFPWAGHQRCFAHHQHELRKAKNAAL